MKDRFSSARLLFPDFGRMLHLPHKPNCDRDDLVATSEDALILLRPDLHVLCEEKLDGSQVGIASAGDGSPPVVRNKNHILVKGYGRKDTNAKAQYAPLWNWVYAHADRFSRLTRHYGEVVGVYGEWLHAEHTLRYDLAPEDFAAYQIWRPSLGAFVDPVAARNSLREAGFAQPPLLAAEFTNFENLEFLSNQRSAWSSRDLREGVVVKAGDGERLVAQFKMRRETFKPREDFNDSSMIRRGRNGR